MQLDDRAKLKERVVARSQGTTYLLSTCEHSERVLDSRPRGRGFEPHQRHCVVSLSKTLILA